MADQKLTGLTADTTPLSTDITYMVSDPAGTPASKKATLANVITKAHGISDTTVIGVTSGLISAASTTGSGAVVLATSATLVTPALGTPSALVGTNITGTASALNIGGNAATATLASTVTTNANLTGPITSSGNATSIASQTGSGTKFVVDTSPTIAGHITVEGVTATGATGTGKFVFDDSPTLTTAVLGSSTATTQSPSDNSTKVATTAYTDAAVAAAVQGLSIKQSVQEATATALPANTYLSGVITMTSVGILTVDGQTVYLNDRVLVKDEGTTQKNGIYTCTVQGTVGIAAVLTRATDSDTGAEILGGFVFVELGTVNAAAGFVNTNATAPAIGTDPITYTQFSGAGEISVGSGLTKSGNVLDRNALTGDVTASAGSNTTTLAAGSASNLDSGTLLAARMPALTGDITTSAGSIATTLATVNSNTGAWGSATQVATFTVNGKGLTTAAGNTTITPAVGSITGLGTGVSTALGINVGSAGAFVTFNGALGTPSSGTATNLTGLPLTTGVTDILPTANSPAQMLLRQQLR